MNGTTFIAKSLEPYFQLPGRCGSAQQKHYDFSEMHVGACTYIARFATTSCALDLVQS
jgi:hypothetical protein